METISYEYEGALYVNLTNRCDCACVFCLRHNGHKGSIYADDLWLEHEPTREEALADIIAHHPEHYRELVFCGFGEPTYRLADLLWLVDRLREQVKDLPPVRINTNGHASLINGRDVTEELRGRIDVLSISLNGATAEKIRQAVVQAPQYREGSPEIAMCGDLYRAVEAASREAQPGDVVLLSPASAGFDQFKNFMERGNVFKKLVKEL